jgi:hypothetical protein
MVSRDDELQRRLADGDISLVNTEAELEEEKPLKKARSKAEVTRVRQGYLLIFLNTTNVVIAGLIALKTFGLI